MEKYYDLYCIPYAGASAVSIYSKWKKYMSKNITVNFVELAGHGNRALDPLNSSLEEVVNDLLNEIRSQIGIREYAIFGHSMGTLISYELLKKIKEVGLPLPKVWFVSGRYPAHIKYKDKNISFLPNHLFLDKIIQLGGTPREICRSKELLQFFLPILKNDYKIIEDYKFDGKIEKFDCDIEVFFGEEDTFTEKLCVVNEWRLYTNKKIHINYFSGGHFFINEFTENICDIISHKLIQERG